MPLVGWLPGRAGARSHEHTGDRLYLLLPPSAGSCKCSDAPKDRIANTLPQRVEDRDEFGQDDTVAWKVSRALLERHSDPEYRLDEEPLVEVFERRGILVERFIEKDMVRGRIALDTTTFVAGALPSVIASLRQIGAAPPGTFDYPENLREFLHRRVWGADLGWVRRHIESGGEPLFIKPCMRKRFTGRVVRDSGDLYGLASFSTSTSLWCSEVVAFVGEHRVFVTEGAVVGLVHYAGDPEKKPSQDLIDACRERLVPIAGYAVDAGVLDDGTTALVEVNDGFSLGRYGLDSDAYADLLLARWGQLLSRPGGGHP